jgi:pimeloyl-ACP methyl ester carboxylesterase
MRNFVRIVAVLLVICTMLPLSASAKEEVGSTLTSSADAHRVKRLSIDPAITDLNADPPMNSAFGNHLVWPVDRSHTPVSVDKSLLYLFLPATGTNPTSYSMVQQAAVDLGYHVIGLAYPNVDTVVGKCNVLWDPKNPNNMDNYNARQSCYLNVRQQTIGGVEQDTTYTVVSSTDTINNRLTKLLVYLADNYPDEGWGGFLDDTGSPAWSRIVVAGHSQGGGNAALIGKLHLVARVVMISSPPDGCFISNIPDKNGVTLDQKQFPTCQDPSPNLAGAQWTSPGATPPDRYYGLAHQSEFAVTPILANWGTRLDTSGHWQMYSGHFDLFRIGAPVAPEAGVPPYGCTHMLLTNLNAPGVPKVNLTLQDHRLTARDDYTPTDQNTGLPMLLDAWRYISAVAPGSQNGCHSGI